MNSDLIPNNRSSFERALAQREEEWQLHTECTSLARAALSLYKDRGNKKLSIADITRLLDLASRLGRLSTGMATEQVEHAWSQYHDPRFIAEIEAKVDRIFGKPINIQSQATPADCSSRREEALTEEQNVELQHAVSESNDTRSE